jgi:hypothetical protein
MLDCALPADLEIRFDGGPVQWERERSRSGVRRPEDSGGGAQDVFMKVWSRLRQVEPARRDEWIDGLYERCEQAPMPPDRHRRLAHAELARLAGAGIEIGAHTMSHPALALLPAADQDVEIRASRRTLEDVTGRQITSFSYPFGSAADYTAETKSIVRAAGFRLACSGTDGRVTHSTDRFELPRLQVPDLDGASFETWLLRKLARVAAA